MWLFLALLAVPIIEITLFIKVGGAIGIVPTLLIVLATAVLGSWLIRRQGIGAMTRLRGSIGQMQDPTRPLFDGAAVLFSGALLLTPGFLTDTLGLLLLVPKVRQALYDRIRRHITVVGAQQQRRPDFGPGPGMSPTGASRPGTGRPSGWTRGDVIEGDYHEVGTGQRSGQD